MHHSFSRNFFPLLLCLLCGVTAAAQDRPVNRWRAHYPYNRGYGVATDGSTIFAATGPGFYTHNLLNGERDAYSKVEGMADVDTRRVAYDAGTSTVVIGYANSNIDLFHPADGSFRNIPDLRLKSVNGTKEIRGIYTENGTAYLSTDIGIVVLNLKRQEVRETYVFSQDNQTIPVYSFTSLGTYFYAATPRGLYRAAKNSSSLQLFSNWQLLGATGSLSFLSVVGDRLYAAGADTVFQLQANGTLTPVYRGGGTNNHLDAGASKLYVSRVFNVNNSIYSRVYILDAANAVIDSLALGYVDQIAEQRDGTVWAADEYQGVGKRENGYFKFDPPPGPFAESAFDILPYNRKVWVAHGSHTDRYGPRGNASGLSVFENETWRNLRNDNYRWVFGDSVFDIVNLAQYPLGQGPIYAGTIEKGLIEIQPDLSGRIYKQGYVPRKNPIEPVYPVTGLAFDSKGNLWMNSMFSQTELTVRTAAGEWYSLQVEQFQRPLPGSAFGMVIDDYDQKWYQGLASGGVMVYNDNGTPADRSDDAAIQLLAGKGAGNLPSSTALCIAKDREGSIWIGTDNGIGIVSCPGNVTARTCEAELRVVKYDQFAGELFKGEAVRTIAVDGANRKWIGTGNGVWLITADANKIVYRFTAENSPLPSNYIQKIAIDPITGDVYIGTDKGMVSFRSTATDGNEATASLVAFPNPVPAGYTGTIAIRGFLTDADVRITDINGQLVYRTKALGGQAVWNGLDYKGQRPQTGVYLVFSTNRDGSESQVGKFLLYE